MARTHYQCTNSDCRATDMDRGANASLQPPPALICWRCKSGSGMSIEQQLTRHIGMLPISTES